MDIGSTDKSVSIKQYPSHRSCGNAVNAPHTALAEVIFGKSRLILKCRFSAVVFARKMLC